MPSDKRGLFQTRDRTLRSPISGARYQLLCVIAQSAAAVALILCSADR
jgi:hypothetical protein